MHCASSHSALECAVDSGALIVTVFQRKQEIEVRRDTAQQSTGGCATAAVNGQNINVNEKRHRL
jgi:hypothetical protein